MRPVAATLPADVAAELKEVATLEAEAPEEPLPLEPLEPFPFPVLDLDPLVEVDPEFELAAEVEAAAAAADEVLTAANVAAEEVTAEVAPAVTVTVLGTGQVPVPLELVLALALALTLALAAALLLSWWCGAARAEEADRAMREREEKSWRENNILKMGLLVQNSFTEDKTRVVGVNVEREAK